MEGPGIFSAEHSGDFFVWLRVPGGLSAHCHTLPQEGSAGLWLCFSLVPSVVMMLRMDLAYGGQGQGQGRLWVSVGHCGRRPRG